jgi:hypothetical protein
MTQLRSRISVPAAEDFLKRSFVPGESIAILIRRESPRGTTQRVALLEQVLTHRYLRWLAHENSIGANVYVAANPLLPGSRRRTKENVGSVRHVYLDIDSDGEAKLEALKASNVVPRPTAILSTSCNKYQVLWRVRGFDCEHQEHTLKLLATAFGGDPACTDCNRVLRVPGFLNCKYFPAPEVTVQYPSEPVWSPSDFRLHVGSNNIDPTWHPISARILVRRSTHSEADWAWVIRELAIGTDAIELTDALAARRTDKSNPIYYAQRTVDVASARLWLIGRVPLEEIIRMLATRRRHELSSRLCSSRAREIAHTAERMIANKTASFPSPKEK